MIDKNIIIVIGVSPRSIHPALVDMWFEHAWNLESLECDVTLIVATDWPMLPTLNDVSIDGVTSVEIVKACARWLYPEGPTSHGVTTRVRIVPVQVHNPGYTLAA